MQGPEQNVGTSIVDSCESAPIELDDFRDPPSDATIDPTTRWEAPRGLESQPLLQDDIDHPPATFVARRHANNQFIPSYSSRYRRSRCSNIMEKIKQSKVAHYVDKLAITSEPGLTNAQLMLTNFDLKPGLSFKCPPWKHADRNAVEPERRQWGAWNYVGFWIADSFNIVRHH